MRQLRPLGRLGRQLGGDAGLPARLREAVTTLRH